MHRRENLSSADGAYRSGRTHGPNDLWSEQVTLGRKRGQVPHDKNDTGSLDEGVGSQRGATRRRDGFIRRL